MAEYIEREEYCEKHCRCDSEYCDKPSCPIWKAPAADVAPVRHGRWVMTLYATTSKRGRIISNRKFACSECGYSNGRKQNNYCPNCGAKMVERKEK